MLDKSIMVIPSFFHRKFADFEPLDTITVTARAIDVSIPSPRAAQRHVRKDAPYRPTNARDSPRTWNALVGTPQTYIKGPYFRGYLHIEVATLKYTRFERARIIGARALQISMGAPVLVDISDDMIDPIEISIIEFDRSAIPMTVKRED